jgi:hypothetical protein
VLSWKRSEARAGLETISAAAKGNARTKRLSTRRRAGRKLERDR